LRKPGQSPQSSDHQGSEASRAVFYSGAIEHARAAGMLPDARGELIAGDFFETIPTGADA
jgi:hypothetical protein